ncbi:nuclear transport factor 2 family protein [Rhodococcus sp. NPDC058521]|uniref:nuclear transport factor 2 family protein n=1 Tax=Rhodococcus sp. NPDC058521 TaxID=3346536 RepID=UPI00364F68A7
MSAGDLVTAFCGEWAKANPDTIAGYFTEDAVYHNIPMEPVVGRDAIRTFVAGFVAAFGSIDFDVRLQVVNGDVVMNERVDVFSLGGKEVRLPVVGVFEIRGDRIAAWRDYFDMAPIAELSARSE